MKPEDGSQCRLTANTSMSKMPTMNGGITEIVEVKTVMTRSTQVDWKRTASAPRPKPKTTPSTSATPAAETEMIARLASSWVTGKLLIQLLPKLPVSTWPSQLKYCAKKGRSRPH